MTNAHRVVIIGGGFAGLQAARALRSAAVSVTLIDRRNFHLFQPLLYQVATGGLSPANIAAPLRSILRSQRNARVVLGDVIGFDPARKMILLHDGEVAYDSLILATGARHHYFGHEEWADQAPGLKTIEDAVEIRRRVLSAFEAAEKETDPERRQMLLTFVIVGAGPTGVEMAGAIGELAQYTLRREFRSIDSATARVMLIEGLDRVLNTYAPVLSGKADAGLRRLGVDVRLGTTVAQIEADRVTLKKGDQLETVAARTVIWGAGVQASPLGKQLAAATGVQVDRIGRPIVGPDLSLPGWPDLFVIGDLAHFQHGTEKPLPGVAPVAMQQGKYVARVLRQRLAKKPAPPPFRYQDRGSMAVIGRAAAVAEIAGWKLSGFPAWLVWLFIHLIMLVEFQNQLLVLIQWGWSYFTRNRSARLITGESAPGTVRETKTR